MSHPNSFFGKIGCMSPPLFIMVVTKKNLVACRPLILKATKAEKAKSEKVVKKLDSDPVEMSFACTSKKVAKMGVRHATKNNALLF